MRYSDLYNRACMLGILRDHMLQEPLVGLGQGGPKVRRRSPAKRLEFSRLQPLERHAVGLAGVEAEPAAVTYDVRHGPGGLGDRQVGPAAEVDRLGVVVAA